MHFRKGWFAVFLLSFSPLLISDFIRTLLEHFIKQVECPAYLAGESNGGSSADSGSLFKIGQTVASMFKGFS